MSQEDDPIPVRGHQGWAPSTRLRAGTQLRTRLNWFTEVVAVAEAGAEYLCELLGARTVTVTTYKEGRFQDLVNVGHLPSGEVRYPKDCMYPETMYPVSSRALHEQGGYITSDTSDPLFLEFYASMLGSDATSMMGVAIVSGGVTHGEVFLTRGRDQTAFDRDDFELARDLATTLGSALLAALRRAAKKK